jgi:hypothetical protein
VAITDKSVDVEDRGPAGPFFRRTLTLRCAEDRTLWFRAAMHAELETRDDGTLRVGRSLTIRARSSMGASSPLDSLVLQIRPSAKDREAITPVTIREGVATVVLEYRWTEMPK